MNVYEQLRREEGCVPHAYQDHLGYVTIGVGRLIDKRKGGGLTDDEIDYLLRNDVERCIADLRKHLPFFDSLSEPRQAVLIGMRFQMGMTGLLGFRKALAEMERGDFTAAAEHMLDSRWATQTPGRAARMARQLSLGEWQS